MNPRRGFIRPMHGWWRRNPSYKRYLVREATSVFVGAYALVVLWGLVRLAQGEASFEAWLAVLRSPLSIALHAALLAAFVVHTVTWFVIMPKTMPPVVVLGHRLAASTVTAAGIGAAATLSAALLLVLLAVAK